MRRARASWRVSWRVEGAVGGRARRVWSGEERVKLWRVGER